MRNTIIPLVAILLLVAAFASAQPAGMPAGAPSGQPRGHAGMAPGMGKMGQMSQMPKLTADQRKQLFDLSVRFFNETAPLKFSISEKRMELDSLWNVDNPDAQTILAKWSEIDSLQLGLRVKMVNFRLAARKIAGKTFPFGMGKDMGMGMCPCMGGGMMGEDMMMPGMGGMGSGPERMQIQTRVERTGAMPEGNE